MTNKIIEIENLNYSYKSSEDINLEGTQSVQVLQDINLSIYEGEFVCVLGRNGSGKSTLARHLNGLILPTDGDVIINGMNTKDHNKIWDIRRMVGMIFQNPDNQMVANTVEEDVAFGLENIGYPSEKIRDKVYQTLKEVSMYDYRNKSPHMLSGGQKQRVAIASIIAMEPKCIILDEPTAMLDPSGRSEVIKTIQKLNEEKGTTIILITHYMEEAVQADRVIVIDQGKIYNDGTPENVFRDVSGIKKIGLDVPQVTELAYRLRNKGISLPDNILNIDEMVMKLCQLF